MKPIRSLLFYVVLLLTTVPLSCKTPAANTTEVKKFDVPNKHFMPIHHTSRVTNHQYLIYWAFSDIYGLSYYLKQIEQKKVWFNHSFKGPEGKKRTISIPMPMDSEFQVSYALHSWPDSYFSDLFSANNRLLKAQVSLDGSVYRLVYAQTGEVFRVVSKKAVTDKEANVIEYWGNFDDVGIKFYRKVFTENKDPYTNPDLAALVSSRVKDNAFLDKLAETITKPYSTPQKKAQALLDFTQNFEYFKKELLIQAKSPKQTLLEKRGDCEDLSVLAASLLEAAGFRSAIIHMNNPGDGKDGHAAVLISKESGCEGNGIVVDGEKWIFAETTKDFKIGKVTYSKDYFLFEEVGGDKTRKVW